MTATHAHPLQPQQADPPDSWQPLNLALLPDKPPVQPTLGGVGLVYPGKRHVFSGPQESAKTLAAYAIAIEIIRQGGLVVVIDFEMGAWDARNRLRELGATPDEISRVAYLEPHEPATPGRIDALISLQPALMILDAAAGAYDLQGLDDNKRGDVEKLTSLYVRRLWRAGIATIILDHVVKNTEGRGKYAIGSERKVGGADVHLGFETILPVQRGGRGVYRITTHKDRGGFLQRGTLADLELTSDPATHQIRWAFKPAEHTTEQEDFRPTLLMERVSRHLEKHPGEGFSRTQIADEVKGKAAYLGKAIDALVREGFATETAGPRGAKLIAISKRYRSADPDSNPQKTPPANDPFPPLPTPSQEGVISPIPAIPPRTRGEGREGNDWGTQKPRPIPAQAPFIHDDPEAQGLIELYAYRDEDAPDFQHEPEDDTWNAQP